MSELQQPHGSGEPAASGKAPIPATTDVGSDRTLLSRSPDPTDDDGEDDGDGDGDATVLGFPPVPAEDDEAEQAPDEPAPDVTRYAPGAAARVDAAPVEADAGQRSTLEEATIGTAPAVQLVPLRRADRFGSLALVLAGGAAGLSLLLPWFLGTRTTGLSLVRAGLAVLRDSGVGRLVESGLWQPLAVVLGGGVLLLLGLLLRVPARSHRLVGVLALLVAVVAAAGLAVPLAGTNWTTARLDLGTWVAVAVPVLGVLGALKAMLTAPRITLERRRPGRAARAGRRSRRHGR